MLSLLALIHFAIFNLFNYEYRSVIIPFNSRITISFPSIDNFFNVLSAAPSGNVAPVISLSENALKHLNRMKAERNQDLCLRIGVKQGGCSGMSYTMEFENRANAKPDDSIIESNGFVIGTSLSLSHSLMNSPLGSGLFIVCYFVQDFLSKQD